MALAPIDFPNDPDYGDSFEASNGITYTWLGNRWRTNVGSVDINVNPEDITFNTLADVSVANPTSDDIVYWNNQDGLWEAKQLSEWLPNQSNIVFSDQNTNITGEFNFVTDPLLDLSQLHDVTVTDPQIGDTIKWSGTAGGWVNGPACENSGGGDGNPGVPGTLEGLSDVTITTPQDNQVLKYLAGKWVNLKDETGSGTGGDGLTLYDVTVNGSSTDQDCSFSGVVYIDRLTTRLFGANESISTPGNVSCDSLTTVNSIDCGANIDCESLVCEQNILVKGAEQAIFITPDNSNAVATAMYGNGSITAAYGAIKLIGEGSAGDRIAVTNPSTGESIISLTNVGSIYSPYIRQTQTTGRTVVINGDGMMGSTPSRDADIDALLARMTVVEALQARIVNLEAKVATLEGNSGGY